MSNFKDYAKFYDALYQDKNYAEEVGYIRKVFNKHSKIPVKSILNLGSGTGNHDGLLAEKGYEITGVDLSTDMIKIAEEKNKQQKQPIRYKLGDLRTIRINQKFDAVLSLFAVMGYQTTNEHMIQALTTVNKHLKLGGVFICDLWFGPAVLALKPEPKTKKVDFKGGTILRTTTPSLSIIDQTIDVHFDTSFEKNGILEIETRETHTMRFFFYQELMYFFESVGLEVVGIHPSLKLEGIPSENDWNIMVIARKPQ